MPKLCVSCEKEVFAGHIICSPCYSEIEGRTFNPNRQVAFIWDIEDVQSFRPDLSDEQALEVLLEVKDRVEWDVGLSWEVLQDWAEELFPEEETEEIEG